jgi:hypothetical protein
MYQDIKNRMRLSIENAAASSGVVLFWDVYRFPQTDLHGQRNFATAGAAKRYAHGRWDGIIWHDHTEGAVICSGVLPRLCC